MQREFMPILRKCTLLALVTVMALLAAGASAEAESAAAAGVLPEPVSILLFGSAVLGLALLVRRLSGI